MRLFITGSESFVGRELISQCKTKNIAVVGMDTVKSGDLQYEYKQGDIRSADFAHLIPEGVDAVIHLAALSRDPDCEGKSYKCFDVNVMGTLNVLRAARARGAKQFIFASSESVYGNFTPTEVNEESLIDITKLNSEYAFSKFVSENNLRQEFISYPLDTTVLRITTVYGPRKKNWSAVESLVDSVKNDKEITVGSLKTGRRFLHISDLCVGILKALGLPGYQIINLSNDLVMTLGDVIAMSAKIFNKKPKVIESNPQNISIRNSNNAKAKKILNWQPEIDLEHGLRTLL